MSAVPVALASVQEWMRQVANALNPLTRQWPDFGTTGKVGAGTESPSYQLHAKGTFGCSPGSSVTPLSNGDLVLEATSNTTVKIKLKGSDGVVRSVSLTLT